jgi:hypothetical protein
MIIKFKIFENNNKPQIGYYAIMTSKTSDKDLLTFLENNIVQIIYISEISVIAKYEYIPQYILEKFKNIFPNLIRTCDRSLIIDYSKNKEELEIKINTKKFNI